MKYYYNGKLVRTSEHTYTHAVIYLPTGEAFACRNGLEKAEAAKQAELSGVNKSINHMQMMLDAANSGKDYIINTTRFRGRSFKEQITMTIPEIEKELLRLKSYKEQVEKNFIVVPLTAE